ncbi:MAG TPA: OsmC family protein [Pseudonocardiaceae bacterium]|jgi:organic hydroperoxide reductase OsmC/OhrA
MSAHQHSYRVTVAWTGNRGEGTASYRAYDRTNEVRADGPPMILGSADPTFRGDRQRWNPEQLLLAALSQCHLLSYLHVAVNAGVVVVAYEDDAAGTMVTDNAGAGRFTEVVLRPRVEVAEASMVERATALHERAHELCFIANSVAFPVRHEPATSAGTSARA